MMPGKFDYIVFLGPDEDDNLAVKALLEAHKKTYRVFPGQAPDWPAGPAIYTYLGEQARAGSRSFQGMQVIGGYGELCDHLGCLDSHTPNT